MNSNPLELTLDLTLEQQFQMRLMEQSAQDMSREQAISLLLETARLLMIKDNAIRSLVKQIM
jgi:hypothetical protein